MTPTLEALWPHLAMFVSAFGAATLLPFSSEVILAAALKAAVADRAALVASATLGNVAGSTLNWWMGRCLRQLEARRWFPFSPEDVARASARFSAWGVWVLLFAWVPVIGDPLTLIAGVMRVPLVIFLPLVAVGKLARYLVIAWIV